MDVLDQVSSAPDPKKVSPWPVSFRYAIIWAGVGIVTQLLAFLTNSEPDLASTSAIMKALWMIIGFGIAIWAVVTAIKTHRDKELGGYISLGRGMGIGTITGLISGAISGVYMLLHTTVINTNWKADRLDAAASQYEEMGMADEQIEMAMEYAGMFMNPGLQIVFAVIGGVIIGFLIGLIAGAIMKREAPKA